MKMEKVEGTERVIPCRSCGKSGLGDSVILMEDGKEIGIKTLCKDCQAALVARQECAR